MFQRPVPLAAIDQHTTNFLFNNVLNLNANM